jgi:cytochrome P450
MNIADDDIVDPSLYSDEQALHAMLTHLRQNEPVRWTQPRNYRPFWTLTKHADVMDVERRGDQFIASPRNRLQTIEEEQRVMAKTGGKPLMRTLPTMDDPDHRAYRSVTRTWFQPSSLRKLEPQLASLAREYVDRLEAAEGSIDFVKQISVWIPLRVIMMILGIPASDGELMHRLTGQLFSPHDPDTARATDGHAIAEAGAEFFRYFGDLLKERRANPREDLASVIANATVNGEAIDPHVAMSYCVSITAAGHETTAGAVAGGLHALISHPDQYRKLREQPQKVGLAVEEILRYVSPVRSFIRVAVNDCELRGQRIKAGDSLLMLYPSANRDEEVFENSQQFRVDRETNPHIAFGHGAHVCLGLLLARMEMTHFFREFVSRVDQAEFAGSTSWVKNNFLGGPKSMPVHCRFGRGATGASL